tara:strand:+ start:167 stop:1051 length:885 start_codon:yes stop_codon:yes gene_type:complete
MSIKPKDLSKKSLDINSSLKLFQIYKNLKHVSLKSDTYFQVYEEIFSAYVGKSITFVEVGVLHGGSLFMWREYFGKQAKIIGIDLHPAAKELEKHGFEIYIGSQSDPNFWKNFYSKVGKIDILLDDGGHGNIQQVVTLSEAIHNINDDGLIVTEDVHDSYIKKFGNPSKHSFINYSKYLIDVVNSRFPYPEIKKNNDFRNKIYSISFYESIVSIKINSKKSIETTLIKNNDNEMFKIDDLRNTDHFPKIAGYIDRNLSSLHRLPVIKKIVRYLFYSHNFIVKIKQYLKLSKYFK